LLRCAFIRTESSKIIIGKFGPPPPTPPAFRRSHGTASRILLLLANFGKEGRPEPIVGKFSQATLAEMIGTTRSRVSFFMNKFRKLGYLDYNGKIEIHNSLLNVVLYDKPEIKTKDASDQPEFSD
jgi:CRP/FNR family cyclic AMP-dependent transcriptional regulator